MKYAKGDIVRYIEGKVDWEIINVIDPYKDSRGWYILKSGMSGRRMTAFENEIRPWVPHER